MEEDGEPSAVSVELVVAVAPTSDAPCKAKGCSLAVRSKEGFPCPAPAKAIHHSAPAALESLCFQTPQCRRCSNPAFFCGSGLPPPFRNPWSTPSCNRIAVFTADSLYHLPAGLHCSNWITNRGSATDGGSGRKAAEHKQTTRPQYSKGNSRSEPILLLRDSSGMRKKAPSWTHEK